METEMTVLELRDLLANYPSDAAVVIELEGRDRPRLELTPNHMAVGFDSTSTPPRRVVIIRAGDQT
jgi:hypothetical protein